MLHPVTSLPLDYEHVCRTCAHFTDKTRSINKVKHRTIRCALDPEARNLADIHGTAWGALPSCTQRKPLAN
jgi:hypothetical protein